MNQCPNCKKELPEGEVICPNCGHEIQLVPVYETLASTLIEKENREKEEEEQKKRDALLIEEEEKYFRKNRIKRWIIRVIVAAVCIATVIFLVHMWQNRTIKEAVATYDDYYSQALAAYNNDEYEHAAGLLNEALKMKPGSVEALILQAKITNDLGNKYDAIAKLKEVIALDPEAVEAYRELIEIYQSDNDSNSINELLNSSPESMRTALSDYISGAPIFSVEPGIYNIEIDVAISSTGARIYYTTDGSNPTKSSTIYTEPIHLTEGKNYLKAVSETDTGVMSSVTEALYTIDRNAPDPPSLSPSSGAYYAEENKITIAVPNGCTCYYAFDSRPTTESTPYTEPVAMLEGDHIFYAILVNEQGVVGPVSAATFIYRAEAPAVVQTDEVDYYSDYHNSGSDNNNNTPSTTTAPAVTGTETPTASPTVTAAPEPTETETPASPSPTASPKPSETTTPETTEPAKTETPAPTETAVPDPTTEPTPEPTLEPTQEPTQEPSQEPTQAPTAPPEPVESNAANP